MTRSRAIFSAAIFLGLFAGLAVLAPWLAPYDPSQVQLPLALLPPSSTHWLGTDQLGRDVLSRLMFGARISLTVGVIAVTIAIVIGSFIGAIAGWYGGWIDAVLMRLVDTMLSIPTIFLLLAIIALAGPSVALIMVVIGVTSWMGVARLVRAEVLSLKEREFVLASRVLGASAWRLITTHLLPNAAAPVLVSATLGVGGAILTESSLSFLGLGVQPPTPSWGSMLNEGRMALGVAWWLTACPGLCIFATVLAFNIIGEGIRERLSR